MQNNKGYTIPELIIVGILLGIISIFMINKASYAFVDTEDTTSETKEMILTKSANAYGNSIKGVLAQEKTKYITSSDLVDAGYLADDEEYKNIKIKLIYKEDTDTISVEFIK